MHPGKVFRNRIIIFASQSISDIRYTNGITIDIDTIRSNKYWFSNPGNGPEPNSIPPVKIG